MEEAVEVGLVLAEEELAVGGTFEAQLHGAELLALGDERIARAEAFDRGTRGIVAPRPGVAEKQLRDHMDLRRLRTAVHHLDAQGRLIVLALGVGDPDLKKAVLVEDSRIEQLVLGIELGAEGVGAHQVGVGISALRIRIHHAVPRVARQRIDMPPEFLGILAVIAFSVGEAEEALLENAVLAVPHCDRETEDLVLVAPAKEAILAPSVGAAARVVVGERLPRRAVGRVILANRAPLSAGDIGSPCAPVVILRGALFAQPTMLGRCRLVHIGSTHSKEIPAAGACSASRRQPTLQACIGHPRGS